MQLDQRLDTPQGREANRDCCVDARYDRGFLVKNTFRMMGLHNLSIRSSECHSCSAIPGMNAVIPRHRAWSSDHIF